MSVGTGNKHPAAWREITDIRGRMNTSRSKGKLVGAEPLFCFDVFLDISPRNAKLPWAVLALKLPSPQRQGWSHRAVICYPRHPKGTCAMPEWRPAEIFPWPLLFPGDAKHPQGWGVPAILWWPQTRSTGAQGDSCSKAEGSWCWPWPLPVSCSRKRTEISDCKACWTPPWTAKPTRPSGTGWRWRRPRRRSARAGGSRASPWRTVMRKMKRTIREALAPAGGRLVSVHVPRL